MESTTPSTSPTIGSVTATSVAAAFGSVPDPRREASVVYPVSAILALATAALLCAHTSVLAMAHWGACQSPDLLVQLGFSKERIPCQSTIHRLFATLDTHALAGALQSAVPDGEERERGSQGIAFDGNTQACGGVPGEDGSSSSSTGVRFTPSRPSARSGTSCGARNRSHTTAPRLRRNSRSRLD